tara:strand:- start:290 stop:574 length:285 start_codon:yes stop_codon:yes gene_type:complete
MNLEDYNAIKNIVDDIIGINTKQGNNLKKAIKNYFDNKPVSVKLVARDNLKVSISGKMDKFKLEAEEAMKRYTNKLRKDTQILKEKGEYCGVSG